VTPLFLAAPRYVTGPAVGASALSFALLCSCFAVYAAKIVGSFSVAFAA